MPWGGAAFRGRGQQRDQVDGAVSADRECGARADRWSQAEGDFRRASGVADRPMPGAGFHVARVGGRTGRRAWPQSRLSVSVELRPCGEAQLQKKPCWPANRIAPTWPAVAPSGATTSGGLIPPAWSSSMRHGPRPTWRRYADGRRAVNGSGRRFPTDIGTP